MKEYIDFSAISVNGTNYDFGVIWTILTWQMQKQTKFLLSEDSMSFLNKQLV